jgi:hypothetical protein
MGRICVAEKNVMTVADQVGTNGASDGTGTDNRQLQGNSLMPALTAGYAHPAPTRTAEGSRPGEARYLDGYPPFHSRARPQLCSS